MKRAIITVVGKDSVGIIAKVTTALAGIDVNILDISQTIVNGYFNMMMITDISKSKLDFISISNQLDEIGKEIACVIKIQMEEIFDSMHRI